MHIPPEHSPRAEQPNGHGSFVYVSEKPPPDVRASGEKRNVTGSPCELRLKGAAISPESSASSGRPATDSSYTRSTS